MSDWVTNSALIIFLIVTIGDKALSFLKTRGIDLQSMSHKIDDLHSWHNHDDPEEPGVKIWWNRKYVVDIIKNLDELQKHQITVIKQIHKDSELNTQVSKELLRVVRKLIDKQDKILQKVKN